MPVRILREGILTSDRVEKLSHADEVFYRRLMSVVDDFGRFDARPSVLRSALYPLRIDKVREADIVRSLACCQEAGLLRLYASVDGKAFLEMIDFRQAIRAKKSKYPDPPEMRSTCEADAKQMHATAHLDGDVFGDGVEDERRRRGATSPLPFPSTRFAEAWEQWKDYSRSIGKPVNEIMESLQFRDLKPLGEARSIAMIETSIKSRWKNLREPEAETNGKRKTLTANEFTL